MDQSQQVQIKADDNVLKGVYANAMNVAHTKEEFVLDFISVIPPMGTLSARIFTSPGHMKRIVKVLSDNIEIYEKQFGKISEADEPSKTIGFTE